MITPGWWTESDHEIVWVAYDLVSLKLTGIWTYWHRGTLQTNMGVIEAKEHGQRPKIFVQWGKHGLLPIGWEALKTVRPKVEMYSHFLLSKIPPIRTGGSSGGKMLIFPGDYTDYVDFSVSIDSRTYIRREDVYMGVNSDLILRHRIQYSFGNKPQWPREEISLE